MDEATIEPVQVVELSDLDRLNMQYVAVLEGTQRSKDAAGQEQNVVTLYDVLGGRCGDIPADVRRMALERVAPSAKDAL